MGTAGGAAPRVLFLTTDMPRDGETGGQIASWRVLEAYSSFARVDVLAITPPGAVVPPELRRLAGQLAAIPMDTFFYQRARLPLLATLIRSQLGGRPYRIAKFDLAPARAIVDRWVAETRYDLVHCDHLATTSYAARVPGTPFVVFDHDVESHALRTWAATQANPLTRAVLNREADRTRTVELDVLRRSVHTFAISADDARRLVADQPELGERVSVLPVPLPAAAPVARRREDEEAFTLLVLGPLHTGGRLPGLRWLLSEVWPSLRAELPRSRLLVVGAGAPPDVRRLHGREGIEVRGFVEDLDGVLGEVDVCVMPLPAGGGIRIKVLELLPRSVPCLGSRLAVRGFEGVAGVYEANSPSEWLAVLRQMADRPAAFRRAALAGAAHLRAQSPPQATARALRKAFAGAGAQDG